MSFSAVCSSTPSPLPFTASPVHTRRIALFHPEIRSFTRFSAQRLKIHCCRQTIQLEIESGESTNFVKKKRKPRPSFVEQVESKWSVKIPSLRENFPWEARGGGDKDNESEAERAERNEDDSSETDRDRRRASSETVDSDVKFRSSSTAPWAHGSSVLKRKVLNSEGLMKQEKRIPREDQSFDEGRHIMQKAVTSSEGKRGKSDTNTIETSETNGILKARRSEGGCSVKDTPNNYQVEDFNVKHSHISNDLGRLPWERKADDGFVGMGQKMNGNTLLAERLIPESELKRLRNVSLRMVERIKVGAAGVTQDLVNAIHEKWKSDEVVKLKFEGPPSKNMNRTQEILECRSGGLVIYKAGSLIVLYRGISYKLDCVKSYSEHVDTKGGTLSSSQDSDTDSPQRVRVSHFNEGSKSETSKAAVSPDYFEKLSEEEQIDLTELNSLLDELGPRFTDWSGREPIPVDADLLPPVVHGFKSPFRLLPHGFKQALGNREMTFLRRTARILPPHFALGRNRELQGLAQAMVKLWENSAIAKIAIKRGVQNTSNERMAEELKILTGGTLISRNKEYVVFYRGNDFLPPNISSTLIEAERSAALRQAEEEHARIRASTLINSKSKESKPPLVAGTLAETVAASSRGGNEPNGEETEEMLRERERAKHASLINSLERKLAIAKDKIRISERALAKVLENQEPENLPTDLETLTDEERFLFRKMGLSMKPYLELGRRSVFAGTIENIHLHWKYRELVKIVVERKNLPQVKHIAVTLEAESGGILVSVDRTAKGHVIIIYRGKNYRPPISFRPRNLLTKRQALARSVELQRREALKHHVRELEEKIEKLKLELV